MSASDLPDWSNKIPSITTDSEARPSLPHVYQNLPEPAAIPPPLPEKTYLRKQNTEETGPPPLPEKTYLKSLSMTSMTTTTSEINNNSLPVDTDAAKTSRFRQGGIDTTEPVPDVLVSGISETQPVRTMSTDKFYRVNFDFEQTHPHELGKCCPFWI